MTIPAHSVKHVRNRYRKFQIIAAIFATLTIAAAFLAAASGMQTTRLQKQQSQLPATEQPLTSDVDIENKLSQQIEALSAELADEKSTAATLRKKVDNLERRLAAMHKTVKKSSPPTPVPSIKPIPKTLPVPERSAPTPEHQTSKSAAPATQPSPVPKAAPEPKPAVTPELPPKPSPVVKPVPTPPPAPQPTPAVKPGAFPVPTPSPVDASEPKPVPKPEPAPAPQPDPTPEPQTKPETKVTPAPANKTRPATMPAPVPKTPEINSNENAPASPVPAPEPPPAVTPQSNASGNATPPLPGDEQPIATETIPPERGQE